MSRATPWAPNPNAVAAASATAQRMTRNVGGGELHRDLQLCESREDRINDNDHPRGGRQDVHPHDPQDQAGYEVRQESGEDDDQDGRYDVGDVGDKPCGCAPLPWLQDASLPPPL